MYCISNDKNSFLFSILCYVISSFHLFLNLTFRTKHYPILLRKLAVNIEFMSMFGNSD